MRVEKFRIFAIAVLFTIVDGLCAFSRADASSRYDRKKIKTREAIKRIIAYENTIKKYISEFIKTYPEHEFWMKEFSARIEKSIKKVIDELDSRNYRTNI
ncbi:MAG: hypothetical protein LBB13_00715 [Rickettsiales bacterium]|jgi:hypothetical protein|nr:hypothetical protein [Rickettsiales bacterium]